MAINKSRLGWLISLEENTEITIELHRRQFYMKAVAVCIPVQQEDRHSIILAVSAIDVTTVHASFIDVESSLIFSVFVCWKSGLKETGPWKERHREGGWRCNDAGRSQADGKCHLFVHVHGCQVSFFFIVQQNFKMLSQSQDVEISNM